jgi:cyclic AMP-dependent transcription factor ATF-2
MLARPLPMQPFEGFSGRTSRFDSKMAMNIPGLYGSQECWGPSSLNMEPYSMAPSHMQPTTDPSFNVTIFHNTPSAFTAANALAHSHTPATISPLQTHFDPDQTSPSFDSTNVHMPIKYENPDNSRQALYSSSSDTSNDSHSPKSKLTTGGRRRKSEDVETGSARAIYLEKNRKAASKCRNKQKRQQEDLVEEAREVERRNRLLKAEVEMLRAGMRELMDHVAQHTDCPDSRLQMYVQREADRLATGNLRNYSYARPLETSSKSQSMFSSEATSPVNQ